MMSAMSAVSMRRPPGLPPGPITRAVLDTMPDDGHRYELIDGILIVSPSPRHVHQRASGNLHVLLRAGCPEHLEVLYAPFDVVLADDTVLQPDLLVACADSFTVRDLPVAPLLAVEILSPSTRGIDLLLKKDRLERAGCAHYWVIDPDVPNVTAWTLRDGVYVEAGSATGDQLLTVAEPFELTVRPSALVGR